MCSLLLHSSVLLLGYSHWILKFITTTTRSGRKLVAMVKVHQWIAELHWAVDMQAKVNEVAYQIQTLPFLYPQTMEEKNHQPDCRIYLLKQRKCNYSYRKQKMLHKLYFEGKSLKSLNIRIYFFLMKSLLILKAKNKKFVWIIYNSRKITSTM